MSKRYDLSKKKDVDKISERIKWSFKKLSGSSHGVDDCVQYVLCQMLEGKHQRSTIDQIVIDYLRLCSGRKGMASFTERKNLEHAITHGSEEDAAFDGRDSREQSFAGMDCERMLNHIGDKIDRGCFVMFHKWGLSDAEIGHIFGFSQSRVSQRVERVQKCLSARIESEARREKESAETMAGVLHPQTKRISRDLGEKQSEPMAEGESWPMATLNEKSF